MDEFELTKIWKQHKSAAIGLAVKILGNQDDAEDVVQEIFLAMLHQPQLPNDPKAYLLAAARQRAVDVIRGRQRRCNLSPDLFLPNNLYDVEDETRENREDQEDWGYKLARDIEGYGPSTCYRKSRMNYQRYG